MPNKVVLEPRVSPTFAITHFCNIVISDLVPYQNMNQRSLTPRWSLNPSLLGSRVWHYPRIIVSKSHEITSKCVDTVTLFSKTYTKGHWPLDDLWPHVCWGHMCDSTQGSLCPSPMGIHQCMWIQWSFLQNTTHCIRTYILNYIHVHTTYRMSDHIVFFWTRSGVTKKSELGTYQRLLLDINISKRKTEI